MHNRANGLHGVKEISHLASQQLYQPMTNAALAVNAALYYIVVRSVVVLISTKESIGNKVCQLNEP